MASKEVKYGDDNYGFTTISNTIGDIRWQGGVITSITPSIINEGSKDMMGLYEVYVVDTKRNEEVVRDSRVIAKDEDRARMIALTRIGMKIDIDNCHFFVRCIGTWEDKKPKEVKIVKE